MDVVPRKYTRFGYEIVDTDYKETREVDNPPSALEACLESSKPILNWLKDFTPETQSALSTLTLETLQNARLLGENWILNQELIFDKGEAFGGNDFYSNGEFYDQMSHYYRNGKHWLYYGTHLVNYNLDNWVQDNFRVISFAQRACPVVLKWLERNAVKIQFRREGNDRKRTAPASGE